MDVNKNPKHNPTILANWKTKTLTHNIQSKAEADP